MKSEAWVWTSPGEPEGLKLESRVLPEPGVREICVENRVAAFNPVDWKLIESGHPVWSAGHVPGVDGMGVVVAVGEGVSHLRPGARVAYHADLRRDGSFARHTLIPARAVLSVPAGLSDETAAAFPCPGLTAWLALAKLPEIKDEALLVAGAGSNVGRFVVALALRAGARVFAAAGPAHHDALRCQGVCSVADYHDPAWVERLLTANGGAPFHVVVDIASGRQAASLVQHIDYSGHLVAVMGRVEENLWPPFSRCVSLHEVALGAQHQHGSERQWQRMVMAGEGMLQDLAQGRLPIPPVKVGEFANLPQWLSEFKGGGQGIKYLVRI